MHTAPAEGHNPLIYKRLAERYYPPPYKLLIISLLYFSYSKRHTLSFIKVLRKIITIYLHSYPKYNLF